MISYGKVHPGQTIPEVSKEKVVKRTNIEVQGEGEERMNDSLTWSM